ELGTPKILVCPADKIPGNNRVIAGNWSASDPVSGYLTVGLRTRATSYTVGLDAFFDQPRSILSGDRNIRDSGLNGSCSSGVGDAHFLNLGSLSTGLGWTNAIHFQSGNLLFYDGQVEQLSLPGFSKALNGPYFSPPYVSSDNG